MELSGVGDQGWRGLVGEECCDGLVRTCHRGNRCIERSGLVCRQARVDYNPETRLFEYTNLAMTLCHFLQASPLSDRLFSP